MRNLLVLVSTTWATPSSSGPTCSPRCSSRCPRTPSVLTWVLCRGTSSGCSRTRSVYELQHKLALIDLSPNPDRNPTPDQVSELISPEMQLYSEAADDEFGAPPTQLQSPAALRTQAAALRNPLRTQTATPRIQARRRPSCAAGAPTTCRPGGRSRGAPRRRCAAWRACTFSRAPSSTPTCWLRSAAASPPAPPPRHGIGCSTPTSSLTGPRSSGCSTNACSRRSPHSPPPTPEDRTHTPHCSRPPPTRASSSALPAPPSKSDHLSRPTPSPICTSNPHLPPSSLPSTLALTHTHTYHLLLRSTHHIIPSPTSHPHPGRRWSRPSRVASAGASSPSTPPPSWLEGWATWPHASPRSAQPLAEPPSLSPARSPWPGPLPLVLNLTLALTWP